MRLFSASPDHREILEMNRTVRGRRAVPVRRCAMFGAALPLVLTLALAATACGDSDSNDDSPVTGSGSSTGGTSTSSGTGGTAEPITATTSQGTWNGQPFTAASAAVDGTLQPGYRRLTIQQDCACLLQENNLRVNRPVLTVDLPSESSGAFVLGVHQATAVNTFVLFSCSNGSPLGPIEDQATGGTVDVVSDDGNVVTGRYMVSFASGDQLSGTFYAPTCPAGASTIKCVDPDWTCSGP